MPSVDYIPRNPMQYNAFVDNLTKYVAKNIAKWSIIPMAQFQDILDAFLEFQKIYLPLAAHPINKAQREQIRQVQAECTAKVRPFINQFLKFPPVTNADRIEMGIPNHDITRTPHTEVTALVEFEIKLRSIRELLINFWVKGASNKAKPANHDGAVIVWGILDKPPTDIHDLHYHTLASRTPHALSFTEAQRGKTVYIALAWQNERGNIGHWSEILSAIVP